MSTQNFHVVRYIGGKFDAVISGMGRNRGTWDSSHSQRAAQRHARALRLSQPKAEFRVEPS